MKAIATLTNPDYPSVAHILMDYPRLIEALEGLLACCKLDGTAAPDERTYHLEGPVGDAIEQAVHALTLAHKAG